MSRRDPESRWRLPVRQQLVVGMPCGMAVAALVGSSQPWKQFVLGALLVYGVLFAAGHRRRFGSGLGGEMLLMLAFLVVALFALISWVASSLLPGQPWLPVPALAGLAVLAIVLGVATVLAPLSPRGHRQ